MYDVIFNILTFGLKRLYDNTNSYYKIIKEFREKLPRSSNKAKILTSEEVKRNPYLGSFFESMTVFDMSTHKMSIAESDIDIFYNRITEFDYRYIFFKNYYKGFTRNLNRFNPKAKNGNFDLIVLQEVLQENSRSPLKPLDVFVYHLKWKYKITSFIYTFYSNKRKVN